jgi:hypothetical protein
MDSIAPALNRACEILEGLVGTLGTILAVALGFGLLFLCVGLTILVLWRSFSFGFRFTVLKAWVKVQDYLTKYFNRLRRYGLTRVGSRIAVACALIVWTSIILGFAFEERLLEALILSLLTLLATFAWSWLERGPRARLPKFTRGFLEPTLALAVPTFVGKSGDFIFQFIVRSVKAVL